MIFANFLDDAFMGIGLLITMLMSLMALLLMAALRIGGHMRRDVQRKGGLAAHLKQKAPGVATRLLRWWLFGRRR